MDKINQLIVYLMAIENNAKDIHYNCKGEAFYGQHLFADKIGEGISDFIDELKETSLLGHNKKPLHSSEYLIEASKVIPKSSDFKGIKSAIIETLDIIEKMENVSRGDSKILDDIASKLQNDLALINIMYGV